MAGLIALVIANLVTFAPVERVTGFYLRAIHRYEPFDVTELSWQYDENSRSRYALYYCLAAVAPGSQIVLVDDEFGSTLTPMQRLYGLGDAEHVTMLSGGWEDYLADVDFDRLVRHAMGRAREGSRGPGWTLSVADETGDADPWNLAYHVAHREPHPATTARAFALMIRELPSGSGNGSIEYYLVDLALLGTTMDSLLAGAT